MCRKRMGGGGMTARDLLDRASITDVWRALGGGELRLGRGRAWWRDGDSYSVSLNQDKNVFFDFVAGKGGGILDLVRTVNGCDRRDALRWLADDRGVSLDNDRPLTREEKRRYVQRRSHVESKARNLTKWRRDILRRLRGDRNRLYESENSASAVARALLATGDGSGDEDAWRDIWQHAHDGLRADAIDRQIRRLESASPGEFLELQGAA